MYGPVLKTACSEQSNYPSAHCVIYIAIITKKLCHMNKKPAEKTDKPNIQS